MGKNSSKAPAGAGQAYLKAHGEKLSDLTQVQQEKIARLRATFDEIRCKWEEQSGFAMPATIEEMTRLAVRAGCPPEKLWDGDWTWAEAWPFVLGYLDRQRDKGTPVASIETQPAATPENGEGKGGTGSMRPAAETEADKGNGGSATPREPDLTDKHIDTLDALRLLKATARDKRRTAADIARKMAGAADPALVKEPLADLVRWDYVGSILGRSGGSWITKVGKKRLTAEKRKR